MILLSKLSSLLEMPSSPYNGNSILIKSVIYDLLKIAFPSKSQVYVIATRIAKLLKGEIPT